MDGQVGNDHHLRRVATDPCQKIAIQLCDIYIRIYIYIIYIMYIYIMYIYIYYVYNDIYIL